MKHKIVALLIVMFGQKLSLQEDKVLKTCSTQSCSGKFQLIDPQMSGPIIEIGKVEIEGIEYPEKVKIGIVKRRVMSIYCYDGTWMDHNTGCEEWEEERNPKPSEARKWFEEQSCPVGFVCPPNQECWGSDARKCYSREEVQKVGPTAIKWRGYKWMKMAYHTCVQSWECNKFQMDVDTAVKTAKGVPTYFYTSKDGKEIPISSSLFDTGFSSDDGFTHFLMEREPTPTLRTFEGKCYSSDPKTTKCLITTRGKWKGKVFSLDQDMTGRIRASIFKVKSKVLTVEKGKVSEIGTGYLPDSNIPLLHQQRAPSIESLLETVNTLSLLQLQTIYNTFEENDRIHKIEKILNILVREVSQIKPKLIAQILGGSFSVEWVSDQYFQKCPCHPIIMDPESNCKEGIEYHSGSLLKSKDSSRCISVAGTPTTNLSLVGENKLDQEILSNMPIQEAAGESSSWDDLVRLRISQLYNSNEDYSASREKGVIEQIRSQIPLIDFSFWFFFVSSIIAWSAFVISLKSRK